MNHAVVRAPYDGIVTQVNKLQPGMYLGASTAAFGLVSTDHVWVEANPKETELTYVKAGDPVDVTVDTYPDACWHGTVESIAPATDQNFSLLPAQNSSRQLGQGGAAHSGARSRSTAARRSAAARRHERRGRHRHRPRRAPCPTCSTDCRRWLPSSAAAVPHRAIITVCAMIATLMQALDTTIANVALPYMQGSLSATLGPDHLGADLLHRRRRDHDRAGRAGWRPGSAGRTCSSLCLVGFTVASMLCGIAAVAAADGGVPAAAGRVRRRPGAAVAVHDAGHLPAGAARLGDGDLGHGRDGRADPRADARRLSDRAV